MSKEEQLGIVVETEGNVAKVRATRHGDCKNCGACPGDDAMQVEARNPIGAKAGQRVAFIIPEVNMLQAAFTVYMLPLVAIALGAVAGWYIAKQTGASAATMYEIIGGALAFGLSLVYIKLYDRHARTSEKMQPYITKILS
jgi:sigma-E factor negative regulatory protein RseC